MAPAPREGTVDHVRQACRYFARRLRLAGSLVAIPIGQVLAGPLAAAVGVREAVVLCALTVMVAGGLATAVPAVRRLERTDLPAAEVPAERATA
jgi:hypothetical protein